jgi:hypothetical protein
MSQDHNHLNHATWECKYHVVFTPKYRKKVSFGQIWRHLGTVFHSLLGARFKPPALLGIICWKRKRCTQPTNRILPHAPSDRHLEHAYRIRQRR